MIKLSKHNQELIDMMDRELLEALLEHWGISYKVNKWWGKTFKFTEVDGVEYATGAAAKTRIIEIINEHSDENGIVIL